MVFNLQQFKKESTETIKRNYRRHLVIGEDLFAIALFRKLQVKYGEQNVFISSHKPFLTEDFRLFGPSLLRGEDNIAAMKAMYPEMTIKTDDRASQFFKELKFRDFGGRSKPETLLWGEEYFTQTKASFDVEELFPFLKDENFLTSLETNRLDHTLVSITKVDATDLVEPSHFELKCSDGAILECERLYWTRGAQRFLDLFDDKAGLSDSFIQFCEETNSPSALFVRFEFDEPISDKEETIFVPLSYTHEYGHFIGEFSTAKNGKQTIEFIKFLDVNETNEEDISRKIRLLKRNMEKIFPLFAKISNVEFIRLVETNACLKIDDTLFEQVRNEFSNLDFVSPDAPLSDFAPTESSFEYSKERLSSLSRGMVSLASAAVTN